MGLEWDCLSIRVGDDGGWVFGLSGFRLDGGWVMMMVVRSERERGSETEREREAMCEKII